MATIELKKINKMYSNKVHAVKDASFFVNNGDFIVLVGPSGCGKTTLLRMIAGLENISEGELLFDGKPMNNIAPKDRDIGMVFQEYALYPHFTVFENIAFPLKVKKVDKKEIKQRTEQVAEMIGLSDCLKRKPAELSGGQRQRVALGRAIIRQPKVFLFDEPLSNLDAKLRIQMRQDIISLQRKLGITSIYVTHDQTEAMTMGTKIAVLKDGVLQQFDTPQVVYSKPANTFVADFIGSPQINLFEGKMKNNSFFENNSGIKFDVSNLQLKNDAVYTFGIRPEKINIGNADYENKFMIDVEIHNIEYLGNETILYFKSGDTSKRIKSIIDVSNFKIGDNMPCHFSMNDILVFDANGQLIADK